MKTTMNQLFTTLSLLVWGLCGSGELLAVTIPQQAQVEIDGSGNMVAVWEEHGGSTVTIQGAYCAALSSVWSSPQQLSVANANSGSPILAINATGQTVAVWQSTDPVSSINSIYAATISLQGSSTWTTAAVVSNPATSVKNLMTSATYQVKLNGSGHAIAMWQDATQSWESATTMVSDGTNSWNAPVVVAAVGSTL